MTQLFILVINITEDLQNIQSIGQKFEDFAETIQNSFGKPKDVKHLADLFKTMLTEKHDVHQRKVKSISKSHSMKDLMF